MVHKTVTELDADFNKGLKSIEIDLDKCLASQKEAERKLNWVTIVVGQIHDKLNESAEILENSLLDISWLTSDDQDGVAEEAIKE